MPASSPPSARFRRSSRYLLPALVMTAVWIAITARLLQIHVHHGSEFATRGGRQRTLTETIPARPGDIVDRHGRLLATTLTAYSVYVNPSRIEAPWDTAQLLAGALDLPADQLFVRLSENRTRQFLWIKRRITPRERERVRELPLGRDVLGLRPEYLRTYPMGSLAAHVLGIRDIDGRGRGGVEERFDSMLRGTDGARTFTRDARGRILEVRQDEEQAPQHGAALRLTVDSVIQLHVERVLDRLVEERVPKSACAIVMQPETADILAMASRPAYDPNAPRPDTPAAWKNTALSSIYEPGSTFKPFIVAWALQQGVIDRDDAFDCELGSYRMGRRILHDHHPYGMLSVTDILVKSSNIGMAKIGERLGNRGLFEASQVFGFGRKTGVDLPGELAGVLRPLKEWTSYSTGSIPMGQELAVTPLQLVTAHAALCNGGRWSSPRLVAEVGDGSAFDLSPAARRDSPAAIVSETVDAEIAAWVIQEPMTQVVARGTGQRAQLEGYTVFGKTGTAQKTDPDTGKISQQLHVSSFLCGAPADRPRALVLVVVDEPTKGESNFGGVVAAPYAAEMLRETLRLLDVAPEAGDVADGVGRRSVRK